MVERPALTPDDGLLIWVDDGVLGAEDERGRRPGHDGDDDGATSCDQVSSSHLQHLPSTQAQGYFTENWKFT